MEDLGGAHAHAGISGVTHFVATDEEDALEQVLASIVMFSLIYLLLGALWIFVLNNKIQHGPDLPPDDPPDGESGLLDAASAMAGGSRSLTGAEEN